MTTIYHGTPMTPRSALIDVCAGRAMCVSFWRPDDVEAVEAISPAIMFRFGGIFGVAGRTASGERMVHSQGLDAVFRLAGTALVRARSMGCNARCARRPQSAQRRSPARVAFRRTRRSALAHGSTDRPPAAAVRAAPARLPWLDRRGQTPGQAGLSCADGGSWKGFWQSLAAYSHDARHCGGSNVSVCQRRRHHARTEWMAI